ncbi:J domain-containing protein [Aurantiacibacter xanthus]|uniref:J domain-containing protein n=1 Tax=Aurantiacibacter xanthus TaxID=1784712 RepID=A0A3A1PIG0_9SPHN|nr:J domain-containing protein [Aurantiacibacter xanthus]RIV93384.1 J domain-containing protein [Aurantiacibacter xanthus]
MSRLLLLAAIGIIAYRWITGRWPWQKRISTRAQAVFNARKLLGVGANASKSDIIVAHKRLVAMVHPDRGGTSGQVHEANDARDLLFEELPGDSDPS